MSAPIRVLELRSVFGTGGGPDKTLLASALRPSDRVALTLCYLRNTKDPLFSIGEQARRAGIDLIEIEERHSLDPAIWSKLRRVVAERGFDIIHGHEYKTDLLAYALCRGHRSVPFATAHGWTGHSWRERSLYYPADKRLLARFPRVVAVSTEIKEALIAKGADPARVTVILNGIDPQKFRRQPSLTAEARARFGVAADDFAIGSVGRLEPQKRFDLLIGAFADIVRRYPATRLLIAGEGSLRDALQAQISSLGLTERIQLVGHVDVIPFHHALNLFVQSSEYEGTPNVVLEAMALETPVVATDAGGTAELVRDGMDGLIIQSGSERLLIDAMASVLGDVDAARTRAVAARQRVESDLSFDVRMNRINSLYEDLVRPRTNTAGQALT